MRLFVSILFLVLFVSFSEASDKENKSGELKTMPLWQAFKERDAPNFKREVEKLLDGTTIDFFAAINFVAGQSENAFQFNTAWAGLHVSVTEEGEDIFRLAFNALAERMLPEEETEEGKVYVLSEEADDFKIFFHVAELFYTLFPPLREKDEYGRTALEVAKVWSNQEVYDTLFRYEEVISEYVLFKLQEARIWDSIPKIKLEETALAQVILQEDFVGFQKAFEALYAGPARDFFAVMRSQTAEKETIFHLLAKVQSQQRHFASGTGQVIRSVLPSTVKQHTSRISHNQEQQEESKSRQLFQWGYGIILIYFATPNSIGLFVEGYDIAGTAMAVLAVEGVRGCYFAWKGRSRKKPKE